MGSEDLTMKNQVFPHLSNQFDYQIKIQNHTFESLQVIESGEGLHYFPESSHRPKLNIIR